jgi:hypothetical protein
MIIINDFQIPEEHKTEIDSLSFATLNLLQQALTRVITEVYNYTFEGPDDTSMKLDEWIESLTIKQYIKLSFYILYLIDSQIYD